MGLFDSIFKKKSVEAASLSEEEPATRKQFKVAGTSFKKEDIASLGSLNPNYRLNKKELIRAGLVDVDVYEYTFPEFDAGLLFEPDNPHDPGAIKVLADGDHVGYIKKGSCAQVRNLINGGKIKKATVLIRGGNYKCVTSLGIGEGDYELDKNSREFSVTLVVDLFE